MALTVTYTFSPNTTAASAEVNQNFTDLTTHGMDKRGDTMTGSLLFSADNTYDIGASGATRPRDFFLGRNATITGTLTVSSTAASALDVAGGLNIGSGNVALVGTDGKLTALTGTYIAKYEFAVVSKTASYTAANGDYMILCDATSGAITITLPAASGRTGMVLQIKKTDSSANAITIDGNASETIDGSTTQTISAQYTSLSLVCDGSNWHIF